MTLEIKLTETPVKGDCVNKQYVLSDTATTINLKGFDKCWTCPNTEYFCNEYKRVIKNK